MNEVLLYYLFTDVADPASVAAEQDAFCRAHGLKGRILVAREGINGTVSGSKESCEAYVQWMATGPFGATEFKREPCEEIAFKKLFVRERTEMIALGAPVEMAVRGEYLEPEAWRTLLDDPDVVILDGRNDYESRLGRFRGAICPPLASFRDFPEWLRAHRALLEGKKILTYCTGGIRCEKLSAWMLAEGFENVYQLHGGITRYAQHPGVEGDGFEGVNVVFDERVAVSAGPRAVPIITQCEFCGTASSNYVNCAYVVCNKRIIMCPSCEETLERCCSDDCRSRPEKREKGMKFVGR